MAFEKEISVTFSSQIILQYFIHCVLLDIFLFGLGYAEWGRNKNSIKIYGLLSYELWFLFIFSQDAMEVLSSTLPQ